MILLVQEPRPVSCTTGNGLTRLDGGSFIGPDLPLIHLNQNRGATAKAINSLGTYKFKSKKARSGEGNDGGGGILAAGTDKERAISVEDAVCCFCLARCVNNDGLRMLPCSHFFHKVCLDKWLKINALRPLCKPEIDGVSTTAPTIGFGRRHSDNRVGNDIESQQ